MKRRALFGGFAALLAAPAVIRVADLMAIRPLPVEKPRPDVWTNLTDSIIPSIYAKYSFQEHVGVLDMYQSGVLLLDAEISDRVIIGQPYYSH